MAIWKLKTVQRPYKKWRRMDFKCCFRICVDGTPKIKEAAVIAIAKNG
jgi:hypothetical protein